MKILRYIETKKIFREAGCWTTRGLVEEVDAMIHKMLINIAIRSEMVNTKQRRKVLTKDNFQTAYDGYRRSYVAEETSMMIDKINRMLGRLKLEVEDSYEPKSKRQAGQTDLLEGIEEKKR